MILKLVIGLCVISLCVSDEGCYWNRECPYQLFGSKTPYDTIRGDLRDIARPKDCKPISFWSLQRHGNRNPEQHIIADIKDIVKLKDDIVAAYDAGRSKLCATDIDTFRKWKWNNTIEDSPVHLTGVGYEELYDIGKRIRLSYPELLNGTAEEYYFRPTNEQRTIVSSVAFVHGFTDGTNLRVNIDNARKVDNVIRPYKHCVRYQKLVKRGALVKKEVTELENADEYNAVKKAIQQRLGISYQITTKDVYSLYEICQYSRSWDERKQSPWCSVFTDEDLIVLGYKNDVKHYYSNGYGSWVNVRLGQLPMKDLYETFQAAVQGSGRKITSYFSHDTMMEMVFSALGLFKDLEPLKGTYRNESRLWKSSIMGAMASNLMAVLNSCHESGVQTHRVQIFIGEKVTDLCPVEGCTWEEFQQKFQPFTAADLDFCSLDYKDVPAAEPSIGSANNSIFS